jgi:4-hydroxybenzoate polyprenyltransferase
MASKSEQLPAHENEQLSWYSNVAASTLDVVDRIKHFLVYSTLYLVAIAMIEVATVHVILSVPWNPAPVVVGLVTFSVYAGDRIADADTDELSNPKQSNFVVRHKRVLSVLTALSYGLAVAISVTGGPVALAITLVPGGFWILYASDWLPEASAFASRLKEKLVVGTGIVSLAWALSVVVLPLAFADAPFTPLVGVLFVYFFIDTFVTTEIINVRDVDGDAAIGVDTFPVVFGVDRTRHILYCLDLLLVGIVGVAVAVGIVSFVVGLSLVVGLVYALGLAYFVGRSTQHTRMGIAGQLKHLVVYGLLLLMMTGL